MCDVDSQSRECWKESGDVLLLQFCCCWCCFSCVAGQFSMSATCFSSKNDLVTFKARNLSSCSLWARCNFCRLVPHVLWALGSMFWHVCVTFSQNKPNTNNLRCFVTSKVTATFCRWQATAGKRISPKSVLAASSHPPFTLNSRLS